ncbi:MAG TPA: poly-beta-1,6-N-acetyl-D-glucosamine biosynthesis protein PgaD [Stellaceae bacterium]|nr:poly-beta-1,6-N-acetyl-D-glucosamine biosynthesis protein PgaD [Stellaceae bacterium]
MPRWFRIRDGVITALVWLFYLWLISDAFVFIWHIFLWLFWASPEPKQFSHAVAVLHTLGLDAVVIGINAALLIGWALYNQVRFRGRERRKPVPAVSPKDLAEMYGFPVSAIKAWQAASIVRARLAENGRLINIDVLKRPSAKSPAA